MVLGTVIVTVTVTVTVMQPLMQLVSLRIASHRIVPREVEGGGGGCFARVDRTRRDRDRLG